MARLLVVEDEAKLAATLKQGLEEEGLFVDAVDSAESARTALWTNPYDLIVLDLRLPGQNGLDFLQDLRRGGSVVPVLILTARDSIENLVSGLDGGADDYLTKPFSFPELLARIRALLRRQLSGKKEIIAAGELVIDTARRRAWRRGRRLNLSPKELMMLEYLVRHAGVVVSRERLGEAVWDADYNGLSNIVEVFVNRLREKIDLVNRPSLIVTVRGAGYMFRVDLSTVGKCGGAAR